MKMEEIYPRITHIKWANIDKPLKSVILVAINDMNADILLGDLGSCVRLTFEYDQVSPFFILWFELPDTNRRFKFTVDLHEENKQNEEIMAWVALNKISEVWVGHPDGIGKVVPYGLPKPVVM